MQKNICKIRNSAETMTFSATSNAIPAFQVGCIDILSPSRLKELMYIIKALKSSSKATLANYFLLMISTCHVVGRVSAIV